MEYPIDFINKITCADCLDIMRNMPDKCVDLVLTDPPYGINNKFRGGNNSKMKKFNNIVNKNWDIIPLQEYFDEMYRISKNQIIFGGNYFYLSPTRCFIVWDKLISKDFSLAMVEYAWTSFDKIAKIYRYPSEKINRIHETQKPLRLFSDIIRDYSKESDIIFDPFSGSGTTAIACNANNRRFICIEKDPEYHRLSVERLEKEKLNLFNVGD